MDTVKVKKEEEKKEEKNTVLKAGDVVNELQGSYEQRMEEEKTMFITLTPGKRPVVTFTGFWNGKLISAAVNSIAKAYRLRRHRVSHPAPLRRVVNQTPKNSNEGKAGLGKEKGDV